jgi:hypothetical protein
MLFACAPSPPPIQALPPGATPEEVVDYAIAQAHYRAAEASGEGDIVMQADNTFARSAREILSREDPRLVDAWIVCERYRVAGPHDPPEVRSTFPPQFVRDCQYVDRRYNQATGAIRRDLELKIAAADLATITQAIRP